MTQTPNNTLYERIYTACEQIPLGQVASYGDIATIVGGGCDARTVGYALNELPKSRPSVPWQRIISKDGAISTHGLAQRQLLEQENVAFDERGRVIIARCHWIGPSADWAQANDFHTLPPRDEGDRAEQLSLF